MYIAYSSLYYFLLHDCPLLLTVKYAIIIVTSNEILIILINSSHQMNSNLPLFVGTSNLTHSCGRVPTRPPHGKSPRPAYSTHHQTPRYS